MHSCEPCSTSQAGPPPLPMERYTATAIMRSALHNARRTMADDSSDGEPAALTENRARAEEMIAAGWNRALAMEWAGAMESKGEWAIIDREGAESWFLSTYDGILHVHSVARVVVPTSNPEKPTFLLREDATKVALEDLCLFQAGTNKALGVAAAGGAPGVILIGAPLSQWDICWLTAQCKRELELIAPPAASGGGAGSSSARRPGGRGGKT